jgi:hypothetical protein
MQRLFPKPFQVPLHSPIPKKLSEVVIAYPKLIPVLIEEKSIVHPRRYLPPSIEKEKSIMIRYHGRMQRGTKGEKASTLPPGFPSLDEPFYARSRYSTAQAPSPFFLRLSLGLEPTPRPDFISSNPVLSRR